MSKANKQDLYDELLEFSTNMAMESGVYEVPPHERLGRLKSDSEEDNKLEEMVASEIKDLDDKGITSSVIGSVKLTDDERRMVLDSERWINHVTIAYAKSKTIRGWAHHHNTTDVWTDDELFNQGMKTYQSKDPKTGALKTKHAYYAELVHHTVLNQTPCLVLEKFHSGTYSMSTTKGKINVSDIVNILEKAVLPVVKKGEELIFEQVLNNLQGEGTNEEAQKVFEKSFEVKKVAQHTSDFGFVPVTRTNKGLSMGFIGVDFAEAQSKWDFFLAVIQIHSQAVIGRGISAAVDPKTWGRQKDKVLKKLDKYDDDVVDQTEL